MTMFTKEIIQAASADPQLAEHLAAAAAAYATAAFNATVAAAGEAKASAEAEAQAKANAQANAQAEAEAQAAFLKEYPKGYIYVKAADEASILINSAIKVGLYARTFVEEVDEKSFIKVVFMRPKKDKKGDKKA